ncbi:MAG: helix-turn-helix domain-containing protein [Nitriliruptorales bacterium]
MDRQSSGVEDLDVLLGGLIAGDNVVWVGEEPELLARVEHAFLAEGQQQAAKCWYVTTRSAPQAVAARLGPTVTVLDARPRGSIADPAVLEQAVAGSAGVWDRLVVDGLDVLAQRWGREAALRLFTRLCPLMFDLGALAYWRASRRTLGSSFLQEVEKVTQSVLEVDREHLRVVKAEGRPPHVQGRLVRIEVSDAGGVRLREERALGRLGEGLRRLRQQRHLNQADLSRLAGVSPSAISQAEAGRRGLSLDTLLKLSEELGISLDELLSTQHAPNYVLARRDRLGASQPSVALLDDSNLGLRTYLVHLQPGEMGTPPMPHKGLELVLVAAGLIQIDLGSATPVMRAGDALLATKVPVMGWRNLQAKPARLFWILRD